MLDVGHGLAVLVETRSYRLLFDAGPTARSGFDSGEEIVLPALAARGRRGLDRFVVSHADNDHAGGAAAIVAAFPGRRRAERTGRCRDARAARASQATNGSGTAFASASCIRAADFGSRGNDSSCVLKVETGASALLVTGDIERRGESAVLAQEQALAADVVVVPHHGSATSSSPAFVAAVGARYAIVSAGHANRWGFPRPEVRERWRESGARRRRHGRRGCRQRRASARGRRRRGRT